jgi:hypothetical protein
VVPLDAPLAVRARLTTNANHQGHQGHQEDHAALGAAAGDREVISLTV